MTGVQRQWSAWLPFSAVALVLLVPSLLASVTAEPPVAIDAMSPPIPRLQPSGDAGVAGDLGHAPDTYIALRVRGAGQELHFLANGTLAEGSSIGYFFLAWEVGRYNETRDGFFGSLYHDLQGLHVGADVLGPSGIDVRRNVVCDVGVVLRDAIPGAACFMMVEADITFPSPDEWMMVAIVGNDSGWNGTLEFSADPGLEILGVSRGDSFFRMQQDFGGALNAHAEGPALLTFGAALDLALPRDVSHRLFGYFMGVSCGQDLLEMGVDGPPVSSFNPLIYYFEGSDAGAYRFTVQRAVQACLYPGVWLLGADILLP